MARTITHPALQPLKARFPEVKLQVGEYVEKGASMFSLIDSGPVWIEANFKETQLTYMVVGQPAKVIADAYPDREFTASVETIASATGAEFAVLPPQNASGNWVKVVQRLPVKLRLAPQAGEPPLRAGMTATVRIDTGRERTVATTIGQMLGGRSADAATAEK